MSVVNDIGNALEREVHWLHGLTTRAIPRIGSSVASAPGTITVEEARGSPTLKENEPRALLRIEVTSTVERDLWEYGMRSGNLASGNAPITFQGVSVYAVRHDLPECGWRIINPMREAR